MKTFQEFMKKFDEELSMTTSAVPGAGDDSSTVVMRKKYDRKNKRKDQVALLKRFTKNP
jgi:hypothetical protein